MFCMSVVLLWDQSSFGDGTFLFHVVSAYEILDVGYMRIWYVEY